MNIQDLINSAREALTGTLNQFAPNVPPEIIRYGGAAILIALSLLLLIFALRLMRPTNKRSASKRVNVPRALQKEGVIMDVLNSGSEEDVAVRCVVTAASSGKIKCEIIERLDVMKTKQGKDVVCVFAPMKTDTGKVNSFTARLIESDTSGRKADRIVLAAPADYAMLPRRKHTRKRVADQQFIRVKLWVDNPYVSDISFEDAAPHIGVNSFAASGPDQSANAVVNISNGGLGLSVVNQALPETCAVGSPIAINLFMFNFKEKSFKPYWYTGEVRSMEEGRPGFTRMGIEFNGSGSPLDNGGIRWTKF
ncbi:hypothetical protein [Pseudodesulfovibrio sp. zrk46]|uniref:hypothetical protein n=1 Tax=Pseudodesulfovibrio sp. zrk46 TaxID=2725288 RepID=UPI0014494047|nr:hypothetical protein [Pseudodesulfovibrio sp. zrk46]QJB58074.1 hypothetical protein HFN16_17530 [Pseudodesulfovibrio sp. zrk46]